MRLRKALFVVSAILAVSSAAEFSYGADTENASAIAQIQEIQSQAKDIIGLEYILAVPNGGPIYGRWGHSLIRLVNPKIPTESNLVISFVADVTSNQINYIKGVFGGYSVMADVETFGVVAFEHNQTQDQDLDRYVIAMKPSDLQGFLSNLVQWLQNPKEMGDYTFLSNNCAGALSRLFSTIGLIPETIFPKSIPSLLKASGVSPFPPVVMKDYDYYWNEIASAIGIRIKALNTTLSLTDAQIQAVLTHAGPLGLGILLYKDPVLNSDTQARLRTALAPHLSDVSMNEIDQTQEIPAVLYEAPESPADFAAINATRLSFFGQAGLSSDLDFLAAVSQRAKLTDYETIEVSRIESDPTFRNILIKGDFSNLSPNAQLSLAVQGKNLVLTNTSQGSDGISFTTTYDLGGSFSQDSAGFHIGDLTCPFQSGSSGALSSNCRPVEFEQAGQSSVRIIGFK